MSNRLSLHLATIAIGTLALSSCSRNEGTAVTTIAVIPKGTTHEFWKSVHAGAMKAEKELGVKVIWKGPLKEDDRDAQIKVIEHFLSTRVSGIVLAPLDNMALREPVAAATKSGVPVVIIDSGLESKDYVSFVATDNHRGGQLAGEHMAKLLGGKGRLVMLRYQEGSASTMERESGFLSAFKDAPGFQIVSANQYGGATAETAYQASERLLLTLKTPEAMNADGIFCPNESTTFGMLRALQNNGLAGKVTFIGFDGSKALVDGLRKGEINALVLQNPTRMGYLGVKTIVQHLRGQPVEKRVDTGVTLITRETLDTPETRELLGPES